MKRYIALDIGGTKVKHGIVTETGEIIERGKYDTQHNDLESFIENLEMIIDKYNSRHDIEGIAVSLPGFINYKTGYAVKAGAIEVLHGKNLKEILEKDMKLPVEIENDANCAALAERFNGNAVDCKDFVCMTVGTGIGGAIMVNDKILHGNDFRGGEVGFMITCDAEGDKRMMNQNSSTRVLIEEYKKYKKLKPEIVVEGHEVFDEAKENEDVNEIVESWFERLSRGIFNLVVILNPEKILIGGGVSEREGFISNIEKYLNQISVWKDVKVKMELCKYGNNAGLIGAVYNFMNRHKESQGK